jgi:hypothetical protein
MKADDAFFMFGVIERMLPTLYAMVGISLGMPIIASFAMHRTKSMVYLRACGAPIHVVILAAEGGDEVWGTPLGAAAVGFPTEKLLAKIALSGRTLGFIGRFHPGVAH